MYNLSDFGSMICDEVRMQAYLKAMKKAITPDSIVLDLGTGTGVMAFWALKFGAKFVYAIESNDLIHVAEEMAKANGLSSKMKFVKDVSTSVVLDQKADVIISDLRGVIPLFGMHIPSIIDARTRLLKPGGAMIPLRDTLWISVVESPKPYAKLVEPWEKYDSHIDMGLARKMSVNNFIKEWATKGQMLTSAAKWTVLDYSTILSPNVEGRFSQKALRTGIAHGFTLWYDAELFKGVGYRNTPGIKSHPVVYGSAFFPFQTPVKVSKGNSIEIQIKANLVDNEYIWSWNTRIADKKDVEIARFEQSTFYSHRLPLSELKKNSLAFIPSMNMEGELDKFILDSMNGRDTIEQIAQKAVEKFPSSFKDARDASARVSKLAKRYSK